jgi:pimeloyl-ACP methyl ester carboxylesterase
LVATDAFTERRWSSDGLTLFARDYSGAGGEARLPVFCLHGLTRNSKDFEEIGPRIAATGRRVIALDFRGRGQSEWDTDPTRYNPKVYAADTLKLMDSLGIARGVFLGTSMGGIIMFVLASLRSRAISAAIINDVGPQVAPEGIARIMSYVGKKADISDWKGAVDYVRRINGDAFPRLTNGEWEAFAKRTFVEQDGRPVLDYDPAILAPLQNANPTSSKLLAWFLFRRLSRKRPTLMVRGGLSDLLSGQISDRMQASAPKMRQVVVPDVGHAPLLNEAESLSAIFHLLSEVD